jgi:hypothetical protein
VGDISRGIVGATVQDTNIVWRLVEFAGFNLMLGVSDCWHRTLGWRSSWVRTA